MSARDLKKGLQKLLMTELKMKLNFIINLMLKFKLIK